MCIIVVQNFNKCFNRGFLRFFINFESQKFILLGSKHFII